MTPKEDDVRDPAENQGERGDKPGRKERKTEQNKKKEEERGKGIKKTCLSKSSDGEKREKRRRD